MRIVGVVIVLAAVAAGIFQIAGRRDPEPAKANMQVCATIAPLADWAREVAGDDIRVVLLVDGYKDPHHFEPVVIDAVRVSASRALLAAGLGLDPWAEKLVENAGKGAALEFIDAGAWVKARKLSARMIGAHVHAGGAGHSHKHDHDHGEDPHYWQDPRRAMEVVRRLGEEFGRLDPGRKDAYAKRAADYIAKLKELDEQTEAAARKIPPGTQAVVFHDAYGYLFERMGVKVAAVVQGSPGVEPSLRDCAEALRVMREIGQQVIFKEPSSSQRAIDMIAQDLKISRTAVLDPLDNGDSPVGKNYLERMAHNIRTVGEAFEKR